MAPFVSCHKGLLNGPGQNNCFLNSAVQVLWHLDIFRRSFRELSGHACMSDSCIFCALKDLFGQLQFSHERALPPDSLRKALAQSFTDQHRFQLGFMDDAAECFENILLRIHFHIAYEEAEDMCNAKHCIPHQKFAMTLVEQSVCGVCHATSEPLPFTQMVHYVSASALISQAEQIIDSSHPDLFGQLLKKAGGMGDIRDCPSLCGAKIQIRRTLINRPEIVSVGIVWDSDRPSLEHIMSLLSTLRTHLRLSDVFHGSFDPHFKDTMYHQLVGVVTYYGKHYSTFFFHTKLRVWVYFDDANVREVGPHWDQVVEKCRRGRYQPLLLLFAIPNGSPLEASDAPKSITLVDRPTMNGRSGHDNIGVGKPPIRRGSLSPTCSRVMGGRRSLTPSPEKPRLGNDLTQRRAVTPNPEQCAVQTNQKQLQSNNDYQNLVQYQEMIFNRPSNVCGGVEEQNGDKRDSLDKHGAGHLFRKDLVRRDSGNWSGDRNSASSSSSTSLENPYHYIIGKLQTRTYGGVPRSPNKSGDLSNNSGNSSGGPVDPGYDSFSLSSTDSLPIQQNLKHNFQLAQIPEGHLTPTGSCHLNDENSRVADDCERLCAEVDQLLDRSEQAEDLITALSLCNAAVNKARAAMDAPYSNPQTASFATMKHNACVLRARSLHRRLEEPLHNNLKYGESRHSREGSGCSTRGSGSSHSRQNSRDKGNHLHSRQNSQELLDSNSHILKASVSSSSSLPLKATYELKPTREKLSPSKNIEIYATLPKNKKGLLSRSTPKAKNVVEDEEYLMKERPGRSLLGNRSKTAASKKEIEKRTRSEERTTKSAKEMITSAVVSAKDLEKEQKDSKKQCKPDEKQQNKKQHKIRRKLLMGGLMRRKNRSMPDLREDESGAIKESSSSKSAIKEISKDDSMVNSKTAIRSNLNAGYLSEGNLEYAGNPNLERSKLMRKSFHGSKVLQFSKVPPPPPLRTTSQLSKIEQHRALNETAVVYANSQKCWTEAGTDAAVEPTPLPFLPPRSSVRENNLKTDAITYSNGGFLLSQTQSSLPFSSFPSSSSSSSSTSSSSHMVVTKALIHHEASFQSLQPSIVDSSSPNCLANKVTDDGNFQLPPYPSPVHSALHSRQASEEFPPPPPATLPTFSDGSAESSFLTMLREKCETMSMNAKAEIEREKKSWSCGDENWLKELQAKQAEKKKETDPLVTSWQNESKNVKDLKYKFEQLGIDEVDYVPKVNAKEEKLSLLSSLPLSPLLPPTSASSLSSGFSGEKLESFSNLKSSLLSDCVGEDRGLDCTRRKSSKKKNVTFCEQVVLVATADDEESDNYIPNPILERVLRTVLHKETNVESREHAIHSVVPLKRTDSWCLSKESTLKSYTESTDAPGTPAGPSKDLKLPPRTKQCGDGGGASAELPNQSSNPPPTELTLDDVDGCCPASQMQNQYHSSSYATSIAYSPTYMPASSFCGSSNAFEHRQSSRSEHPDLMTPVHESVDKSSIGFSESCNEKYARSSANLSTNVSVNPVSRKLNDTYLENVRYSPVCHREESSSQKSDGGESYSGYSSYQTAPAFYQQHYSGSPTYQPMSLQYHLSQSRSSPHHTDAKNSPSATNDGGGSLYPSPSLIRQNSNASYYNQQISPSHDSRRNPVASLPSAVVAAVTSPSPPPSLNSRSQQYPNGNSCNQNMNDGSSVYTASNNGGSVSETLYSYSYEAPPKSVLSNMVSPQHCSNSSAVPYSTSNQHDTSSSLGFTHQISTNHHHSSLGSPSQHGVLSSTNAYQSMCPFSSNSTSSSLTHSISYQHTGSTTSNIHDTSSQQCLSRSTNMQNHLSPNHRNTSSSSGTPQPLLKCNNNNNNNNNNNDNNRNSSSSSSSSTSSSMAHQVSVQHSCNLLNMPYPLSNFYSSSHQTPAQHNFQSTYTATHPASSQRTNSLPHHTQCSQLAVSNSSGPPYNAANVHQMQHGLNSVSPQNSTNTHQPHHYSPNSCDNLCSRPLATISPYQSVPHNSFAYELHSRGSNLSGGISSAYQHSAPLHSVNTSSCAYQPINKFNGTSQRSNLPPVYQHPPPPQPTSSTKCNVYQRVPTPNQLTRPDCSNLPSTKYAAYQPSPMSKPIETKKTNVTSAASIGGVVPCNLCRKKQISPPSVYCADCDFYISRFKQT